MFSCFSISNDASSRRLSSPTFHLLSRPESEFEALWKERERILSSQRASNAPAASSPTGFKRVRMFTGNGVIWINSPEEMEAFQAKYFPQEKPLLSPHISASPPPVATTEAPGLPCPQATESLADPTSDSPHESPPNEGLTPFLPDRMEGPVDDPQGREDLTFDQSSFEDHEEACLQEDFCLENCLQFELNLNSRKPLSKVQ